MKKILTAYFSLKGETYVNGHFENRNPGNTEVVARRIAEKIDTDLFYIEKVGGYPFGYRDTVEIAKEEWHNDSRPAITGKVENIQQYDILILGYPNWCNTMPKAVCTFLESHDLNGKTIVPYCTNEGSGLGTSVEDLIKICPNAKILPGTAIHGAEAANVTEEINQIIKLALEGNL